MKVITLPIGGLQTNCYIAIDDQGSAVVVDPGGEAERILRAVNENGAKVQYILLTHAHFDHIMAVNQVKAATGAVVVVAAKDEAALGNPKISLVAFASVADTYTVQADRVVNEGDTITAGTLEFGVLETPGHTPGSCCYVGQNAIFSGDTLFRETIGRTDLLNGSISDMEKSLYKLKMLEGDYTVYPGHGPTTTLEHERHYNGFF